MNTIRELIQLLTLDQKDENTFVGQNYDAPWGRVFGGQVLGQSLHAAYQTVAKDRVAHSMHGYFILGGDISIPITYEVDLLRDGRSFTTRRVVAKQNGVAIFNMAASFHKKEDGANHQTTIPNVMMPDSLMTTMEQVEEIKEVYPSAYERIKMVHPQVFEYRPLEKVIKKFSSNGPAINNHWFKSSDTVEIEDIGMQQQLLAYASDYNLLATASFPHRESFLKKKMFFTSLDHAMWFHRDFRIDDWILYSMDSPSASDSRGFSRGTLFNKEGELIASVAQEGLMREMKKQTKND